MDRKEMAFAGSWYPAAADECEKFIRDSLKEQNSSVGSECVGGIVPHAGWYYSGNIACRVIAALAGDEAVDTILLFGGHMRPGSQPFLLGRGTVATPFGDIETDDELANGICETGTTLKKEPASFPDENTFELQLPFIKYFFPNTKIVICAVAPDDSAQAIGKKAAEEALSMGRSVRIIGSTDMTHYGPNFGMTSAGTGPAAVEWVEQENDRKAIEAMLSMDVRDIILKGVSDRSMCCPGAAAAAASASRAAGAVKAVELDYATSYEKSASSSFVGYSGVLFACA